MNKKILTLIIVVAIIAVGIGGYFIFQKPQTSQEITNFEQCAKAGYPVMESYPRQCRTDDGKVFVEDVFKITKNISCSTDNDCQLINEEVGFSCCWIGACEEINYSQGKWTAVNKNWFNEQREIICPSKKECGPAPLCPTIIINADYAAKCIDNICKKVIR